MSEGRRVLSGVHHYTHTIELRCAPYMINNPHPPAGPSRLLSVHPSSRPVVRPLRVRPSVRPSVRPVGRVRQGQERGQGWG